MARYSNFHIHGDNIVECERAFDLIRTGLADELVSIVGPNGSPVCPEFQLQIQSTKDLLHFTFYPGFGRWNEDIIKFVRERGGILREAADVVITGVTPQSEEPLIAIEYCGALPAWQPTILRRQRPSPLGRSRIAVEDRPWIHKSPWTPQEDRSSSPGRKRPE